MRRSRQWQELDFTANLMTIPPESSLVVHLHRHVIGMTDIAVPDPVFVTLKLLRDYIVCRIG